MGFNKELSIIAQNAGTTAAVIYTELVRQRGDSTFDPEEFDQIRLAVFQGTLAYAGAETVVETFEGEGPSTTAPAAVSAGGYAMPRPGSDVELRFGKYKGQTIQQVWDSGEDGQSWLDWAAKNTNNDFVKKQIQQFLAA